MLKALDLDRMEGLDEKEINTSYRSHGLKRERIIYSLKTGEGCLVALFVLNFSDVGLNMSSLTNCIQVLILDQDKADYVHIAGVLRRLAERIEGLAPVLLFPRSYADDKGIIYENVYTLGILDLKHISKFIGFIEGLTKASLRLAKRKTTLRDV